MTGSFLYFVLAAFTADLPSEVLTIGSPAPNLAQMAFLKGEAVNQLARGTVYVIEFSGVSCVPCHRVIPLLNKLQKSHPKTVFISVYSGDDEKTVGEYLTGKGKEIGYRVAVDSSQIVWKDWFAAALQTGTPLAFVVDANGKVAWIGHPDDLTDPLAQIVAGTFDARKEIMRLRIEQGSVLRKIQLSTREKSANVEHHRIIALTRDGKEQEALTATDTALTVYADLPNHVASFQGLKMYLLAKLPGRTDDVLDIAIAIAIDARMDQTYVKVMNTANYLLSAAGQRALSERDQRLVDLAMVLLQGEEPKDLRTMSATEAQKLRALTLRSLAWAYHLRGESSRAVEVMQDAVAAIEKMKPAPTDSETEYAEEQKAILAELRGLMMEYRQAAGQPARNQR